MTRISYTC